MLDPRENNELLGESDNKKGTIKIIIISVAVISIIILIILLILFLTLRNKEDTDNNDTILNKFVIKGTFIDTLIKDDFGIRKGYILVEDGLIKDFFEENPINP